MWGLSSTCRGALFYFWGAGALFFAFFGVFFVTFFWKIRSGGTISIFAPIFQIKQPLFWKKRQICSSLEEKKRRRSSIYGIYGTEEGVMPFLRTRGGIIFADFLKKWPIWSSGCCNSSVRKAVPEWPPQEQEICSQKVAQKPTFRHSGADPGLDGGGQV